MKKCAFMLLVALMGLGGCGEEKKAQKNTPKTPAEQEVACNNGDMESCINLAWHSFNMLNLSQAKILFQKACDGGFGVGCVFLGDFLYATGEGGQEDEVKAQKLWDKAIPMLEKECDNNQAYSCETLGSIYVKALYGVQQDFAKGKELAEKACDLDKSRCAGLASIYAEGKGVAQDYSKVIALYEQSCEAGWDMGCFTLGGYYEDGKGVERDIHKAREFYKKACDMGDPIACKYYQRLQEKQE